MDRMRLAPAVVALLLGAACQSDAPPPDAPCEPAVLYLNRTGGTYIHAAGDDSSQNVSQVIDTMRTLPPAPYDDIDWAAIVSCIRTALAPFPVTITETDPGMAAHTELVFTTSYWGGSPGQTSIFPGACRPGLEVGFVFGSALPTTQRACHIALRTFAQMTARLSLADDCTDVLNDDADCSMMRWFNDHESTCIDGARNPVPCRCGGTTQNSFVAMTAAISACP